MGKWLTEERDLTLDGLAEVLCSSGVRLITINIESLNVDILVDSMESYFV